MSKGLKSAIRYRLIVSPSSELLESGCYMAQTYSDHDIAVRLYKNFVRGGMACMLTTYKFEDVRIDYSDDEVGKIMRVL